MINFQFNATMKLLAILLTLSLLLVFIKTSHEYKTSKQSVKKRRIPNFFADFVAISDVSKRDNSKKAKTAAKKLKAVKTQQAETADASENDKGKCPGVNLKMINPKEKASNIAQKAAEDAKAAKDSQVCAGQAAAHKIKLELAEKAMLAAKAAEAALISKQVIVDNLKQEVKEAEGVVEEEALNLSASDENMNIAIKAACNAKDEVKAIAAIVETAKQHKAITEQLANAAQLELDKKNQLVDAAKNHLVLLHTKLADARRDFEKTKTAAYNAACAALEAKQKATERSQKDKTAIRYYNVLP